MQRVVQAQLQITSAQCVTDTFFFLVHVTGGSYAAFDQAQLHLVSLEKVQDPLARAACLLHKPVVNIIFANPTEVQISEVS